MQNLHCPVAKASAAARTVSHLQQPVSFQKACNGLQIGAHLLENQLLSAHWQVSSTPGMWQL